MVNQIYPPELQWKKATATDTEAPFLDLHLSIANGFVSSKIYDKRDDFDFDIVNFPFLDGEVPRRASYGVYISQLIRFARVCNHVADFNARNKCLTVKLTDLVHYMWRKEAIPQEFKNASIIHLYKRKGNPRVCDNHRGTFLLSIAGKIRTKTMLNRLNVHFELKGLNPESQRGFRKDRVTIDMIFTARQLQEKCQEQNVDLYTTFVDLTKALDTVSRDGLLAKFGCPPRFIAMVWQFHDGMQARVQNDGEYSESFESNSAVLWHQHCSAGCFLLCSWMVFDHHCDKFTYLVSTLSRAGHIDDEATARLKKQVWHSEDSVQVCM